MPRSGEEVLFNAVCVLHNYEQRYEEAARTVAQLGIPSEAITLKLVASVLGRACDEIIEENYERPEWTRECPWQCGLADFDERGPHL
jgi:hypothetical protein